jgi:ubiquinone/menaquinone biosynthesis C-methylase UbiE
VAERYTQIARHFDAPLPRLLADALPPGPLALADLGCGDGPLFAALARHGAIAEGTPVYAVDLEAERLARVRERYPWITTLVASADHVPGIPDGSLDVVISTMVLEHVPDEHAYLEEIRRILGPSGIAYLTTVFKKTWAWYFRKRDGESVLDTSHLREYTDLATFRALVRGSGYRIAALERRPLWFPLADPLLFRIGGGLTARPRLLRALRAPRAPIPGYYALEVLLRP